MEDGQNIDKELLDLFLNSDGYTNWQERLRTLRTKRMEDVLNFGGYFQALGLAV